MPYSIVSSIGGLRLLCITLCGLLLSACAHPGGGGAAHSRHSAIAKGGHYAQAESYFRQGQLMQARAQLLAIEEGSPDYQKAQRMLKETIEPARKRLLRYQRGKARKAERRKAWFAAWQAYAEVAELSGKEKDRKKAEAMHLRLRAERANALARQRQREDRALLDWLRAYRPGKAYDANDRVYAALRQDMRDWLDARIERSLRLAKKLRKEHPEIALLLLESVRRLQSERVSEKELQTLRQSLPKALQRKERTPSRSVTTGKGRKKAIERIDPASIEKMIERRQWERALHYRDALRRMGERGEKLWRRIEQGAARAAAQWYAKGREAFANERVDDAVRFWDKAVTLMPGNEEYLDALMRAMKVQERLRLIRGQQP